MKRLNIALILVMQTMAVFPIAIYAGAWTAKQYTFYEKLAVNYYHSNEDYNSDGKRVKSPENGVFKDYNLSNYFEYGLTDRITAINSLAYKSLNKETDQSVYKGYGLGDVDIAVRFNAVNNFIGVVSGQLLVKIPGPYKKSAPLPLGNGQFDVEPRLLYGRSLYPFIPGYCNLEIGYRRRYEEPSDELRYLIELGVDIFRGLYARGKLDGIKSMNNGKKRDGSGNPTSTNNYDLGKLDLTAGYKVTQSWGVEISYVPTLYGRDTAVGATYTAAVFFKTN